MNNPHPYPPPPVYRSKATTIFMGLLGSVMGIFAVTFPATTILHGLTILAVEPPWGFWSSIMGMTFTGLVSVEMFTGHINAYAGELVRAMVERVSGKAGADK